MVCQACHQQGISGGQFCTGCGQRFVVSAYVAPEPRLYRARYGKVIAGVCAGVAARWGWDPILVRLALVAVVLLGCGSGILAYLAAWIVIPKAPLLYTVTPPPSSSAPMEATA